MEEQKVLSADFQKAIAPEGRRLAPPLGDEFEHRLDVAVVFTSAAATIAALRRAGTLANRLSARIKLIVPQIVPYPLPLESPPVLVDFSEHRFRTIAAESSVETAVQIYLCRDDWETVKIVLAPRSLVVIGGRKRWWPTQEKSMARKLRRAGHQVIFTEMDNSNA
jgi:hypothetical protein